MSACLEKKSGNCHNSSAGRPFRPGVTIRRIGRGGRNKRDWDYGVAQRQPVMQGQGLGLCAGACRVACHCRSEGASTAKRSLVPGRNPAAWHALACHQRLRCRPPRPREGPRGRRKTKNGLVR